MRTPLSPVATLRVRSIDRTRFYGDPSVPIATSALQPESEQPAAPLPPGWTEETVKVGDKPITIRQTDLHVAASQGDLATAQRLLDQGAFEVDVRSNYGVTPLMHAATYGHLDMARLLISKGANINAQGGVSGGTALSSAARVGHKEMVLLLLEHGASVDAPNTDGCTPLHLTAYDGHVETARVLLVNGANPNANNKDGLTASDMAKKYGHPGLVDALVDAKGARLLFPSDVPTYPSARLLHEWKHTDTIVRTYETSDAQNRVVEFYAQNLHNAGWAGGLMTQAQAKGPVKYGFLMEKPGRRANVVIEDREGKTTIIVIATPNQE
jgi:hypothetical protein